LAAFQLFVLINVLDCGKDIFLEKRLVSSDVRRLLQIKLNCLPVKQREVLELCFSDGLTQREIAAVMDTPLRTVKIRLELGLRRIANTWSRSPRKFSRMQ
jgi:RNA polymerase sigma factor (sigma-70 family)